MLIVSSVKKADDPAHTEGISALPWFDHGPFDRMLIAQAQNEKLMDLEGAGGYRLRPQKKNQAEGPERPPA